MSMAALILLLLGGGLLAWQAERVHPDLPRWVALATVSGSLLLLLLTLPSEQANPVAGPGPAGPWLAHLKLAWMPRFGIAFELALDGLSLLLLVLTLLLGLVAWHPPGRRSSSNRACSRPTCCGPWPVSAACSWRWTCSCSSCSGKSC